MRYRELSPSGTMAAKAVIRDVGRVLPQGIRTVLSSYLEAERFAARSGHDAGKPLKRDRNCRKFTRADEELSDRYGA